MDPSSLFDRYQSWLPVLDCEDASGVVPRRWGRDLAREMGLAAIPGVEDAFCDEEILFLGSRIMARSSNGFRRVLAGCRAHGFVAKLRSPDAALELSADLDAGDGWTEGLAVTLSHGAWRIDLRGDEAVRQVSLFGGVVAEVVEVTPGGAKRRRRPPPSVGSARLQRFLAEGVLALPAAPPELPLPAALETTAALARLIVTSRGAPRSWVGLWRLEDLPPTPAGMVPRAAEIVPGEPQLRPGIWPHYGWGDLDFVCVGGGPDTHHVLCDATGAIWIVNAPYDVFDFVCGNVLTWLERTAFQPELDALGHAGPLLSMPLGAPGALAAHLGVPAVRECTDARSALFASSQYVIREAHPTRGRPVVSVRGATADDLVPVAQWASNACGARVSALTGDPDECAEIEATLAALGVRCIDGGTGGWLPDAAWELRAR
ncbi:uncharacterized protein SOCE26_004680 [Sorangium cellulosum]|uniref:Uncharacterized protein n=1 Tax=Sorangium cellulosum TaxID=56 RepID=A0A2L0EIG8_SORCE|nr:hypothetical protein [Sorangium cellulosum]AUX39086.1 uncharacterized protein SOCE26_004680 [Sorangium cellulosum]